jgi:hypothetical protein
MIKFPLILIFVIASSCSSQKEAQHKRALVKESWTGHPISELMEHPYFKDLLVKKVPHDNGIETWVFRQQTKFQTGAYCQSLGGCMGMPQYSCDNTFSVKKDVVIGFEQTGSCPGPSTIEPLKK